MIRATSAPLTADLSQFSQWLTGQGLPHRIVEEQGEQVVYLASDQYSDQVSEALVEYLANPEFKKRVDQTRPLWQISRAAEGQTFYPRATPRQAPVIFVLLAVSVMIAWLTNFGEGGKVLRAFLIVDPLSVDLDLSDIGGRLEGLSRLLAEGQFWRLVSPNFIHFSLLHITFNLLMLWVLGGQLEMSHGSLRFSSMALFVSVMANVTQLIDGGYLFGGMSGLVYGIIGYCWCLKKVDATVFLPDPLFKFSVVWLLLGYTPLTEMLGLGRMANSAHLYGLLAGFLWGGFVIFQYRIIEASRDEGE